MLTDDDLLRIEEEVQELYDGRVESKDEEANALFWDSEESMRIRFETAVEMVDFAGREVLDVGCGFGHFYEFLLERNMAPAEYHGIDLNDEFLEVARDRYPECTFERRNVLREPFDSREFDVAVGFGTLFNRLTGVSNEAYLRRFIRSCYTCSRYVLINAISDYRSGDWPYEEFVYYYSPEKAFGYAQDLTSNVRLRHDLPPIPQKEFHLLLGPDPERPDEVSIRKPNAE
jgi:ubiquinone/menaquinone biosynthesis C-methylase UbiE